MLDQNTTTVLTTLITVLGTLGGVVLGIILSNRYVSKQDKTKREKEVIEEVYQTLLRVDDLITQLAYDVRNSNNRNLDTLGRIKDIRSISQRIPILIRLYLPPLRRDFEEHIVNSGNYWNAIGSLFEGKKANLPQLEIKDRDNKLTQAEDAYKNSLEHVRVELEKLVR